MRYSLRSREALHYLMEHPGRGAPYSVRDLARAAGVSAGVIDKLRRGQTEKVDIIAAHNISEALGVAVLVLFAPPASPDQTKKDPEPNERTDPWHATPLPA